MLAPKLETGNEPIEFCLPTQDSRPETPDCYATLAFAYWQFR